MLGNRRHLADQRHARALGHGQQLELAGLHLRIRRQHPVHQHLSGTTHGVRNRLRATLVRHVLPGRAGGLLHRHARQVRRAADGRHGEVQRLLVRQGHQFLEVVGRHGRMHHQQVGRVGQHRHALEIFLRAEAQLGVHGRADGQRAHIAQQQRVVVRAGLRHHGRADVAVGARAVVHHHGLAQRFAERLADQAGDDVRRAAGGVGHHQPDRLGRPLVGGPGGCRGEDARGAEGAQCSQARCLAKELAASTHAMSPKSFIVCCRTTWQQCRRDFAFGHQGYG
ncbi:hypothetical protein D3C81_1274280 [compost metagenome]